jgi:hypothetical protein
MTLKYTTLRQRAMPSIHDPNLDYFVSRGTLCISLSPSVFEPLLGIHITRVYLQGYIVWIITRNLTDV